MAVNVLLSYAFYQKAPHVLREYRSHMPCGRIMIDSGAFTAHSTGQKITLDGYAEFLEATAGTWDTAVTLDVIGDPATTRRNTRKLHARGLDVMPVFTRGDTIADFDAMVKDSRYVCVGGGVGMPAKYAIPRLAGLQRRARENGGGIHALGVGSPTQVKQIRPYSADSSAVSSMLRYGKVCYYDGRRIDQVTVTDRAKLRKHHRLLQDHGFELAGLLKSGRMPNGAARDRLVRAMVLGLVCADEDTKLLDVPTPQGVDDTSGCHMYSAMPVQLLGLPAAKLDHLIHDPAWEPPPVWRRYSRHHAQQCRATNEARRTA